MEFDHREQELIHQIEELQLDIHRLNNMVNLILPPAPAVEEDPNVLIAEDDGIKVDAKAEPEEEEGSSLLRMTTVMVCLTSIATTLRSSLAMTSS